MGNRVVKNRVNIDYNEAIYFIKNKILNDAVAVYKYNPERKLDIAKTCDVSFIQINRGNNDLNKKDLVAIYAKLTNNNIAHENLIKHLSKKDLNCLIRTEIYRDIIEDRFEEKYPLN